MNKHSDDSTGGDRDATTPTIYLDDVWQTATGRLVDVVSTEPFECEDPFEDEVDGFTPLLDAATSRLLYRGGVFVGDKAEYQPAAALIRFPAATPPKKPRILLVGARRFCRVGERPYAYEWDWAAMQRVRSIDEVQTPTAFRRLRDVGLQWDYAVDLLPPGDSWGADDDARAALSAAYLRGIAKALQLDYIVPLGGKVCKAFRAADARVLNFEVGEEQHGYVPLPSPHARESTWWTDAEKLGRLRGVVAGLGGGK